MKEDLTNKRTGQTPYIRTPPPPPPTTHCNTVSDPGFACVTTRSDSAQLVLSLTCQTDWQVTDKALNARVIDKLPSLTLVRVQGLCIKKGLKQVPEYQIETGLLGAGVVKLANSLFFYCKLSLHRTVKCCLLHLELKFAQCIMRHA